MVQTLRPFFLLFSRSGRTKPSPIVKMSTVTPCHAVLPPYSRPPGPDLALHDFLLPCTFSTHAFPRSSSRPSCPISTLFLSGFHLPLHHPALPSPSCPPFPPSWFPHLCLTIPNHPLAHELGGGFGTATGLAAPPPPLLLNFLLSSAVLFFFGAPLPRALRSTIWSSRSASRSSLVATNSD
jgi:hypothetical protein